MLEKIFDYYRTQGNKNKYIDPLFSLVNDKNNPQLLMLLEHTVASFDRLQVSVEKEEAGTKWRHKNKTSLTRTMLENVPSKKTWSDNRQHVCLFKKKQKMLSGK